jgi:hypothetical protein
MRILFWLFASFLCTTSVFGQLDFHRQKAEMISQIIENVRKSMPKRLIYVVVDLTYTNLQFANGPAGPNASTTDSNTFDSAELLNLTDIWRHQINNGSVIIVTSNYEEPLKYQRLIDSIRGRTAVNGSISFVYLETYVPIGGWNKLQFYRQDQAYSGGDAVFMRYLSPDIHVPAHIYYETGQDSVTSDEIFTFKISIENIRIKSTIASRLKL